jgi:hypothetical protein
LKLDKEETREENEHDLVVPARSLPSLRTRLAGVRCIPLLEATSSSAEGGDQEARGSPGYKLSTSCELDLAISVELTVDLGREPGSRMAQGRRASDAVSAYADMIFAGSVSTVIGESGDSFGPYCPIGA